MATLEDLQRCINDRPTWDETHFTDVILWAQRSMDPSSQVGCVIVTPDHNPISFGYNGPVRGVSLSDPYVQEQLLKRPEKYMWMEHGERNALYNALRRGQNVMGAVLYIVGLPCTDCCRGIIQSGISVVKILKETDDLWHVNPQWIDKQKPALDQFKMAGVKVEVVDVDIIAPLPLRVNEVTHIIGARRGKRENVSSALACQAVGKSPNSGANNDSVTACICGCVCR